MKKALKILFVFSIILNFSFIVVIAADKTNTGEDTEHGNAADATHINSGNFWHGKTGVSISVSTLDGPLEGTNKTTTTVLKDADLNKYSNQNVNVSLNQSNRLEYSEGQNVEWTDENSLSDVAVSSSDLAGLFQADNGVTILTLSDINQAIDDQNYDIISSSLKYEEVLKRNPGMTVEQYNEAVKDVVTNLVGNVTGEDLDLDKYKNEDGSYNLVLGFENVYIMNFGDSKADSQTFIGTAYELSLEAQKYKSGLGYSSGLDDVAIVLRKNAICTNYSNGTLGDQLREDGYNDAANKVPSGSSVGGMGAQDEYVESICSNPNKYFPKDFVTNASLAISISFAYIGDYIDGGGIPPLNPANCQTIISSSPELSAIQNNGTSLIPRDEFVNIYSGGIKINGHSISAAEFFDACLIFEETPEEEPYNCTPYTNMGSCNGGAIIYKDSSQGVVNDEYWDNCVFSDSGYYENDVNKKGQYQETDLGDPNQEYCKVYCIEDVEASFFTINKNYQPVEAGRYIVLNNGTLRESRTCRTDTKNIKYTKFQNDLKDARTNSYNAYLDYVKESKLEEAISEAEENPDACHDFETVSVEDGCSLGYVEYGCSSRNSEGTCVTMTCVSEDSYSAYYSDSGSVKVKVKNANGTTSNTWVSWDSYRWCSQGEFSPGDSGNVPNTNASEKFNTYNYHLKAQNGFVTRMESCYTNWNDSKLLNFETSAALEYNNMNIYKVNQGLEQITSEVVSGGYENCKENKELKLNGCSGSGESFECSYEEVTMYDCTTTSSKKTKIEYSGKLNGVFAFNPSSYQYVDKFGSISFDSGATSPQANQNFTTNYVDIGFGNLPVAYKTPDGTYSSSLTPDTGYLNAVPNDTYLKLGYNDGEQTTVDKILGSLYENYDTNPWECEYEVVSNLIKEDIPGNGDINLIFRPIDLNNPFPDINGNGRETGNNWCAVDNCNSNPNDSNPIVYNYITNNRGVETYDIYNETPMYTFILTPSDIKEIRKYNSENDYNSYTGSLSGVNYDYKCETGTGAACISDYLTHIINITDAKNQPGTCVADNTRTYNDKTSFENCRY